MTKFSRLADVLIGDGRLRDTMREAGIVAQTGLSSAYWRVRSFRDRRALVSRPRPLLLNVGCGYKRIEGWVNLDLSPKKRGIVFYDAHDPLPFDNGAVAHIHTEHFLEHLSYGRAIAFLRECFRVLEPGGMLRVIVPDAERYFRAYAANDKEFFEFFRSLGEPPEPFETRAQIINQMFRMNGAHRFAWDYETLSLVLSRVGFAKIAQSRQHDTPRDIDGTDDWRPRESLYVNAAKS